MRIDSAEIRNFRSIKHQEIKFSPNMNLFIGKNNAGKTNIAKAIELFFKSHTESEYDNSPVEDSITLDDWYLLKKEKPITLKFNLILDTKDIPPLLSLIEKTMKRMDRISTKAIKKKVRYYDGATRSLDINKDTSPLVGITKVFRFESDSKVISSISNISIDLNELYNEKTGEIITHEYSHRTPSGSRKYKIAENPISTFKDELIAIVEREFRFTSPTKERLTKQPRNSKGKDIANRMYNLHIRRRASAKYKFLKSDIEGLPFADGEFRPSLNEDHDEEFAELIMDVADDLSLPIEHFGEGLQSALNILDKIIFFNGGIVAIEEPENSLHPSGQKSVYDLLKEISLKYNKQLILTSHSSVFIDRSMNARLFRVSLIDHETVIDIVIEPADIVGILDDLGFKPSYALLANGVIWVEGPSDRSYIRRWLELNGINADDSGIAILPYGGSNLEHISVGDFMTLNRNFIVIMDSERKSNKGQPKGYMRKLGLKKEIEDLGNYAWITKKRAIDNYIPGRVIKEKYGFKSFTVDPYERLHEQVNKAADNEGKECSYRKVRDSPDLARRILIQDYNRVDELKNEIGQIVERVNTWNK